ncbi:MAG TPA: hypothetical protein VN833_22065 [Candidatus Acidoferrales bacterium]|nr:hypothetical protein [Candidatus Acidoferrales bacterium]
MGACERELSEGDEGFPGIILQTLEKLNRRASEMATASGEGMGTVMVQ